MANEERPRPATAYIHFRLEPERVGLLYSALNNQPRVPLFQGEFPEPFDSLQYHVIKEGDQMIATAILGANEEFNAKFGSSVGTPWDLDPLLQRYQRYEFSSGGKVLTLYKSGAVVGVIGRTDNGKILIQ